MNKKISRVACGHILTVALTTSGRVYAIGSIAYGQLGIPTRVEGKISKCSIEEIAGGSYHVMALTSSSEVYTWGRGANGQLGHGDKDNKNSPTLVDFLEDKQIKSIVCGSNSTAIICLHKLVSSADHFLCSSCHNPFGFRRKHHNC